MQLENSFTVPVPIDDAWRVLLDIERIAPCMPGAVLDSVDGDAFTGRVKVKLGPINLTYAGKASFVEKDEATHRAVIDAKGKDQRGNGTAAAVITAVLAEEGAVTRVDVLTDLNITGRPAQFGRGVMTDVGNKLLGQFADRLAAQLGTAEGEPVGDAAQQEEPAAGTAGAATTAAAASASDTVTITATTPPSTAAAKKQPARKAEPAKAAEPARKASTAAPADPTKPLAKAPSTPPSGPTAPPTKPASGGPARSTPAAARPAAPRPQPAEPEPIDLLEVAGGAALTRLAVPAAGAVGVLVLLALLIRRRRHRR